MATIPKAGITTSSTIEAAHITNIIDALDGTTAVEIDITSTLDVTGTSNLATTNISSTLDVASTSSLNDLLVASTSSLAVTNISSTLNLTSEGSELRQRLVPLNNKLGSVNASLGDYKSGTTFEIDLSWSLTDKVNLYLNDVPNTYARLNYWITFVTAAAATGAFVLNNTAGSYDAYSFETNDNTGATISSTTGTATTAITELRYTTVQIVNRKSGSESYWYIEFQSDSATAFTIA